MDLEDRIGAIACAPLQGEIAVVPEIRKALPVAVEREAWSAIGMPAPSAALLKVSRV